MINKDERKQQLINRVENIMPTDGYSLSFKAIQEMTVSAIQEEDINVLTMINRKTYNEQIFDITFQADKLLNK